MTRGVVQRHKAAAQAGARKGCLAAASAQSRYRAVLNTVGICIVPVFLAGQFPRPEVEAELAGSKLRLYLELSSHLAAGALPI